MTGVAPVLSAILRAPDRTELLRNALESLCRQTLARDAFEVVIVDQAPSEAVRRLVQPFEARLPIRYVGDRAAGRAAAWNTGVSVARGELLLFLDGLDAAEPELLEAHVEAHRRLPAPEVGVLGYTRLAPEIESDPLMHFVTRVGCFLFAYPGLEAGARLDFSYFWAGRSSCKRALLDRHGGFDAALRDGCEDIELAFRASRHGFEVVYEPRAMSTRIERSGFDEFCTYMERQGHARHAISVRYPDDAIRRWSDVENAREIWRQLGPAYDLVRKSGRELDRIARLRLEARLGLAPTDAALLYQGYWAAFSASRSKGIVEGAGSRRDR